jgi:uncharacterized glyoxalase superfamily protein PhnB
MTAIAIPTLQVSSRELVHFYEAAFGARLVSIHPETGDDVQHAELTIDGAMFMCSTARDGGIDLQPGTSSIYFVLQAGPEVDAIYQMAIAAGAADERPPYDADYGGRHCTVRDADGNFWSFGTYRPEGL